MTEQKNESPKPDDLTAKAPEPDHGMDPRRVPGTPQAAAAEALGDPAADQAPVGYVDMQMRKRVSKRKAAGLWCRMGPDFRGCMVRIRPWSARPIQIFRETYESQLRARNPKLKKGDDLEARDAIELNRATASMSVTGLIGTFQLSPKTDPVVFTGTEEPKDVRLFVSEQFLVPFDEERPETADLIDMDFLTLLMGLNDGLSKVPYQEIDRLGEGFCFGSIESLDYSDSIR